MTPSMGMAAPKGMAPAAPQAGLAAIAQPATAPKGMSSGNMAQVMSLARKMSDAQLADVLQGKSLDVPQYVAMTEAMGRKQLRTAMQGQQAMAQAQQPSVKDKLLMGEQPQMPQGMPMPPQQPVMAAEGGLMYADGGPIDMNYGQAGGGIAELPAPNMEPMTMAGGGIVAFADTKPGTETEMPIREDLTEEEKKQLAENPYMQRVQGIRNLGNAFFTPRNYDPIAKGSDILSSIQNWGKDTAGANAAWEKGSKARSGELKTFTNEQTPKGKLVDAGLVERSTPIQDVPKVAEAKANKVYPADLEDARTGAGMTALLNAQRNKAPANAAAPTDTDQRNNERKAALLGSENATGITPEKRVNPFGELKADLPDYAKVKSQGLGEGLMLLSSAMFGTPNLNQAFSKGLPLLSSVSGATRKELSDLKKDYNAQQLNLAKANELYESGQEDLAFKKLKQSQDNAYHMQTAMAAMMQAGKPSGTMELFNTIQKQNPNMPALDIVGAIAGAKQDAKSDQALRDAYLKSPYLQTLYPNIDDYIKKMTPAGATMANNTGGFSAVYGADNRRIQ